VGIPPGHQPYDRLTGVRVGVLAGALLGGLGAFVAGLSWLIAVGAIAGGATGWWYQRRQSG